MEKIIESSMDVVTKQKNIKKLLYAGLGIVFGIALICIATFGIADKKSGMYLLLITFGIMALVAFVAMLFLNKGQLIYTPTKSEIRAYEIFFKSEALHNLLQAIEAGNISSLYRMVGEDGQGIRLNVLLSKDNSFAACQLYKYVPYQYEPASEVYKIMDGRVSEFCQCVREIDKKQ